MKLSTKLILIGLMALLAVQVVIGAQNLVNGSILFNKHHSQVQAIK